MDVPHMRSDGVRAATQYPLHDAGRAGDRPHLHPAKLSGPANMRDCDTIDDELRLLAAVRWSIREQGGEPSSRQIDELLDERLGRTEC
jgi:hypothetical protein